MRLITGEAADAELDLVQKVGGLEARSPTLPIGDLSSIDFEQLNYVLFKCSAPVGMVRIWDRAALMLTGPDEGRDVLLLKNDAPLGIVQCKSLAAPMTRPAVLQELSKCILFCASDSSSPLLSSDIHYFLSLTRDPARTVGDFFAHTSQFVESNRPIVAEAVKNTLSAYSTLRSLKLEEAVDTVHRYLKSMTLHLLRPTDLQFWIDGEAAIGSLFFRHRILVDNSQVMDQLGILHRTMEDISRHTSGVSAITDDDVRTIKEYIDGVPASHRTSVGFASLFGFPREMFAGKENFQRHMESLIGALQGLHKAYISWMSSRAQEAATRICNRPQIRSTVHPFALQIVSGYMGTLAPDISLQSLSGEVVGSIIEKLSQRKSFDDDEERLSHVCENILEQGRRYLAKDYSQLVGDNDLIAFKRQIIDHLMTDIPDIKTLDHIVQEGKRILEPYLKEASTELRSLGGFRPSVFLVGTSGLDSDAMLVLARKWISV